MSTNNNEAGKKNGAAVDDKSKDGNGGDWRGSANEIVTEPNPVTKTSLAPVDRSGSAADDKSKSFEVFDN